MCAQGRKALQSWQPAGVNIRSSALVPKGRAVLCRRAPKPAKDPSRRGPFLQQRSPTPELVGPVTSGLGLLRFPPDFQGPSE